MPRQVLAIVALILAGAAAFWGPIILTFALYGGETLVIANTAAIAVSLLCAFVARRVSINRYLSLWLLMGIYLFGPILLMVANSFIGGGFARPVGWDGLLWLSLMTVVPPFFWLFAGNSGLLPSLAVMTAYHCYKGTRKLAGGVG